MNKLFAYAAGIALALGLLTTTAVIAQKAPPAASIISQTVVHDADKPEVVELESGRLGFVVSGAADEDPNGPNGTAACVCTGYLYNYTTNTASWTTYTTPGCYPNPLLGCRDCCFRVLDGLGDGID